MAMILLRLKKISHPCLNQFKTLFLQLELKIRKMNKNITIIDKEYQKWIKDLSSRYRRSQIKAAVKVNQGCSKSEPGDACLLLESWT